MVMYRLEQDLGVQQVGFSALCVSPVIGDSSVFVTKKTVLGT